MKKKLLLVIFTLLSIIIIPNAFAKESVKKYCYYEYTSNQYGSTFMVLQLKGEDKPTGYITTFNGKSISGAGDIGNVETATGWSYADYVSHKEVCPYYAEVEMSGAASIKVSYDKSIVERSSGKRWDQAETHILVSTTIEKDKATNNETYDPGTEDNPGPDSKYGNDMGVNFKSTGEITNTTRTCSYVLSKKDREYGIGYTSADIVIGYNEEGTKVMAAAMHSVDSKDNLKTAHHEFRSWKDQIQDPRGILQSSITNDKCPYYVYYTNTKTNQLTILNDATGYESDSRQWKGEFLLISTTISAEKSDYDPNSDGDPAMSDYELQKARDRAAKLGWMPSSGTENPFGLITGNVGDDFCLQPETMTASRVLGYFIIVAKIFVPLLIIVWGTFDFVKIVTAGTQDSLKKEATKFGIRVLIGIFIFFVPTLIDVAFESFVYYRVVSDDYANCEKCIFHPSKGNCQGVKIQREQQDIFENRLVPNTTVQNTKLNPGIIVHDPDEDDAIN